MRESISALVSVLTILAVPLGAQDPIRGPMLGYVWDSRQATIRGVLGIVGSSVLGKPLELDQPVRHAVIATNQEFAIALLGDERKAHMIDLRPLNPVKQTIGAPDGAERVILSPRSTVAVLVFKEPAKMVVVGGLPAAPSVLREVDLTSEGMPALVAVSDDGGRIVATFAEREAALVLLDSGDRAPFGKAGVLTAASFLENSQDVLVGAADGVFLGRNGGLEAVELLHETASASALAPLDAGRVLIVENTNQAVLELQLESKAVRTVQCPCAPTNLARMTGAALFRLNEVSAGPLWLVEISENGLRTIFVPPDPTDPGQEDPLAR